MKLRKLRTNARIRRVCSQCGKRKAISSFSKDKTHRGGYKAYCKECAKSYKK